MTLIIDATGKPVPGDPWRQLASDTDPTADYSIIAAASWFDYSEEKRSSLLQDFPHIGLAIDGKITATDLLAGFSSAEHLHNISLLQIAMAGLKDGRSFSLASRLRNKYKYQGEIRASGDYLADQIYFMMRCVFDSFMLDEQASAELHDLTAIVSPFSEVYQHAVDDRPTVIQKRFVISSKPSQAADS